MQAATRTIAFGVLVLLSVAGVLVMRARNDARTEVRDLSEQNEVALQEERDRSESLDSELAGARRKLQQAEVRAVKMQAELDAAVRAKLEAAMARPEEPASADPPGPADWRDVVSSYPAYRPEGIAEALDDVDWGVVAESMSNMPPLIAVLAAHIEEGRPLAELPAETVGTIQRYNGPLITTAMKLAQNGVAGSDVNGSFSHPGFMSNALAAALTALGMPLDEEQSTSLNRLTADFSARETRRTAGYGEDAFLVEKLVDESRLKHEYFQKVYALLTDAQHEAIRPEPVRGRLQLDIFCESLVWSGKAGALAFEDRDDLTTKAGAWVISRGAIPATAHQRTRELVSEWVGDLPDDFLRWETDGLVGAGMLDVEHVTDSAARVLELLRKIDTETDLDDAQRQRLRQVPGSIVMYRQPSGE